MNTIKLINLLRIVPVTSDKALTDENMVKAITLNENVKSLGFVFKPEDIVKIAKSDDIDTIWDMVKSAVPEIKAQPMYPDFPSQVMEMDEATYRFHQLVHYFSTYGLEGLFGVEVKRGWMPDVDSVEKTKEDKSLLDLKVLEVVEKEDLDKIVIKRIAEKKARMTSDERELVKEAISGILQDNGVDFLKSLSVPFKENLKDIFLCVVDSDFSRNAQKDILTTLCQHTGDVLKCIKFYLGMHKFKISTSQKKLFVKMLESYKVTDFEENLMPSNLKREDILVILNYIDYNNFSRSSGHKTAVASLRNKDLTSWYGKVEKCLSSNWEIYINEAIKLLSQRPGEFLRKINEVMNKGVKAESILEALEPKVTALSLPTLVRLNTFFDSTEADERFAKNKSDLLFITRRLLFRYCETLNLPFNGKKVFVEEGMFDFANSTIEINNKSDMSGYVASGMAYKIPDDAKNIRFFTYWDDEDDRVDIDLHAKAFTDNGEVHIGWNSDYISDGIVMSGDITHSNAAEFIDVDLENTTAKNVLLQINDYTRFGFDKIDTVLCGVMAVSELGVKKDYSLYTAKNCFFSNEIKQKATDLYYGYIDVEKRIVKFIGKEGNIPSMCDSADSMPEYNFTLKTYLDILLHTQNATLVTEKEEADVVIRADKGMESELSLIDENFFLEQ